MKHAKELFSLENKVAIVTGGYHYHTVRAESDTILDKIDAALKERDYIAPEI